MVEPQEIKNRKYGNGIVKQKRMELAKFIYDDFEFEQKNLSGKQIEKRDIVTLENGAQYDGDWIKGTNIRQGRG